MQELLLNEHIQNHDDGRAANKSVDLYSKWRELARTSEIHELDEYINKADCFFLENTLSTDQSTHNLTTPSILCVTDMSEETIRTETRVVRTQVVVVESQPSAAPTYLGEPGEFMKCIEKLISSTQIVDKHLDNIQKPHKEFNEFEKQEIKLNAIKQTLESLAVALKTSLLHRQSILDRADKEVGKKIAKLVSNLTKQHQNVVDKYREKKLIYLKNYDKWSVFNKDYETMCDWLGLTLEKVNELRQESLENEKIKEIIKVRRICNPYKEMKSYN